MYPPAGRRLLLLLLFLFLSLFFSPAKMRLAKFFNSKSFFNIKEQSIFTYRFADDDHRMMTHRPLVVLIVGFIR